ncbi:MAG: DUF4317 domain-containing protein [Lachnospiraceae bacterium]|nr:DUF4317 domain-containing protein [Lachnospiraceae bacterium]
MNKKEVSEIKRRIKKEDCSFTRLCGCYVNSNKEKVVTFDGPFWDIEEEAKFKYVEIANKALSGKVGNNLVELEYTLESETEGDAHKMLMGLRECKLTNQDLVNAFYDHVIETYNKTENYLIILFHDVYDIPVKTTDGMKLDDSVEMYEYIICAICPVALSKAGLGYNTDEQNIAMVKRNWIVGPVETAFTFPCFTDRSTDIHSILTYTKDVKNPHHEFWENGLGAINALTSTEKRNAFTDIVKNEFVGDEDEDAENAVISIAGGINSAIKAQEAKGIDEPVYLGRDKMQEILEESGIDVDKAKKIGEGYENFFDADIPDAYELIDEKSIRESEIRNERKNFMKEISDLNEKNKHLMEITDPVEYGDSDNEKVILRVSEDKAEKIRTTTLDGVECLVIPLMENEETIINGKTVKLS